MIILLVFIKKGFIFATFILGACGRKAIVYFVFLFLIRNNLKEADANQPLFSYIFSLEDGYYVVNLKEDERLDYLLAENLRIIQSPSVFAFSLDAVLLARFVYVPIQKGNLLTYAVGMGLFPYF